MLTSLMGVRSPAAVLKIELDSDIVFVTPKEYGESIDPVLSGVVRMSMNKSGYIAKAIRVELRGTANVQGDLSFGYETSTTLHKTLELNLADAVESPELVMGEHAFSFAFTIPSDTACWQGCPWGRVRHQLQANVEFANKKEKIVSDSKEFFITGNVTGVGNPPAPFHQFIQHISDDLGPLSITFSSPYLTVASLVVAEVNFLSPPGPEPVQVISIDTYVSQSYTVTGPNSGKVVRAPPNRHLLRKVDPDGPLSTGAQSHSKNAFGDVPKDDPRPLHMLDKEQEWTHKSFCRIPNDEVVRPSTLPGAKTPIRVDHQMVCEIKYAKPSTGEEKSVALGRPIMMRSCFNLVDDLRVPRYEEEPSEEPTLVRNGRNKCFCRTKLGQARDELAYAFGRESLAGKAAAADGEQGAGEQVSPDGFRRWDEAEVARRRLGKSPAVLSEVRGTPREPDHFLG